MDKLYSQNLDMHLPHIARSTMREVVTYIFFEIQENHQETLKGVANLFNESSKNKQIENSVKTFDSQISHYFSFIERFTNALKNSPIDFDSLTWDIAHKPEYYKSNEFIKMIELIEDDKTKEPVFINLLDDDFEKFQLIRLFLLYFSVVMLKSEEERIIKANHNISYYDICEKLDKSVNSIILSYQQLKIEKPSIRIIKDLNRKKMSGKKPPKALQDIYLKFINWSLSLTENHGFSSTQDAVELGYKRYLLENGFDSLHKRIGNTTHKRLKRELETHCSENNIRYPFPRRKIVN